MSLQVCGNAFSAVIGRDVYNRDQDRSETSFVRFARLVAIERDRYSGRGSGCVMQGQALGNVETFGLQVFPKFIGEPGTDWKHLFGLRRFGLHDV